MYISSNNKEICDTNRESGGFEYNIVAERHRESKIESMRGI